MIESLFQGKSQKTTRERESERRGEACFARINRMNGLLRYKLKRYTHQTFTVFGINRVEPRELNSRPVFGRVFLFNSPRSPTCYHPHRGPDVGIKKQSLETLESVSIHLGGRDD